MANTSIESLIAHSVQDFNFEVKYRDEDPDLVGSIDFWPAGSVTFFIGSGYYL